MGQPTAITVLTDSSEYSRYEDTRNTVLATVQISGGAPYTGEEILVELVKARRSRDAVVGTATLSFTAATSPQVDSVQFVLPDLVDQDMLNLVRHGKYFVRARSVETAASVVIGSGTATPITLTTIETGTDANDWDVQVVVPAGTSPLSASVVGTLLTINLAVSAGVPVAAQNTREAITALLNSTLATSVFAEWTGTAGLSLSAAEGPTAFSGGRDEVSGESEDFDVRIVTVARLKSDFLFGIPLQAGQARMARNQPSNITGVTITEVSTNHPLGVFTLGYTYIDNDPDFVRQLSWNGGPLVSVNNPGTYILRRGNGSSGGGSCGGRSGILAQMMGNDYIVVKVDGPTFLPTSNQSDEILIEQLRLDDRALGKYLCQAEDWLENVALSIYLEPTNVVTDRDPTTIQFAAGINSPTPLFTDPDYDFIHGPLTYFPIRAGGDWVEVQTPYPQLLRVDSLFGSIANTRVIDIDLDWIQFYPQGGMIQLVPFNQTIAFDFLGLIWVNALRGAAAIPNFWHYNMMVGLRDCPCDLQELVAKKAAMDALTMLGAALRPGIGSTSLGRDGVSQSVSYTTQMQYGPYTGAIMAFKDWITENLQKYKGKYRGATLVVV